MTNKEANILKCVITCYIYKCNNINLSQKHTWLLVKNICHFFHIHIQKQLSKQHLYKSQLCFKSLHIIEINILRFQNNFKKKVTVFIQDISGFQCNITILNIFILHQSNISRDKTCKKPVGSMSSRCLKHMINKILLWSSFQYKPGAP